MKLRQQSTTTHPIPFLLVLTSDHITGATGLVSGVSLTVTVSKDGGAFGSPSGAITEIGSGWYALAGNATDRGTLGAFLIHATGTGADPTDDEFTVVAFDPFDSTRLGLTAIPNADANTNGGAPILSGSGTALGYTIGSISGVTFPPHFDVLSITGLGLVQSQAVVTDNFNLPALIAIDGTVRGALTTQGYTTARAPYLDSLNTKTGFKLASDGIDAITIESGVNARQALSLIAANVVGVLSGVESGVMTFYAVNNPTTPRIVATVTSASDRASVVVSPPA